MKFEKIQADILIIGMGAAAQMAALYAHDANPDLKILIVTKALRGKGGCSRMVQGGFNVVLNSADSHEKHLMDTLKGGQYINDQELANTLVEQATPTIKEMETRFGCFFDRNPDGTIHQKAFRRPVLRPHGPQGRPDRHRDHQPPHRAGDEAAHSGAGRMPRRRAAAGPIRPDGHRRAAAGHAPGRVHRRGSGGDAGGHRRRPHPLSVSRPRARRNPSMAWACSTAPARS